MHHMHMVILVIDKSYCRSPNKFIFVCNPFDDYISTLPPLDSNFKVSAYKIFLFFIYEHFMNVYWLLSFFSETFKIERMICFNLVDTFHTK
ncbi:hypothetical protein IV74_GL002252 [Carnobacterium divergens DSM 20623]|uniref:Uncharacterized protein n=1 Tax=Carnobacterium divergens DSM 20623 TaxID=1449336 RepID=A0A0R2HXY7_CARDV|nr:hypothetical protein IV74_GL002252 [Carnobacterium divergens DSM 20623]